MSKETSQKNVARLFIGFGEYEKAVEALVRVVLESPDDIDTRLKLASTLQKVGRIEDAKDPSLIFGFGIDNSPSFHI